MQRNHWAVAPSTASSWDRHRKHEIFLLLQAAQAHLTCEWNNGKRVRYSPVRRNKPYRSNKKHLPQLPQPVFTRESSKQKWGKSLYIVENSRKERLWKKTVQHRWHIFLCNWFNSFNRKISYSFIGIYLLYYLLNRYYKCCRMLKMVLKGCCRVLKDVERVLNGVGHDKAHKMNVLQLLKALNGISRQVNHFAKTWKMPPIVRAASHWRSGCYSSSLVRP